MKTAVLSSIIALTLSATALADAKKYSATLISHTELLGQSFLSAHDHAPAMFNVSGRFTDGERKEKIYSIHDSKTSLSRPFSVGREQGKADDNEFILLEVGEFSNTRYQSGSLNRLPDLTV